ncbi:TPA: KxYKxGKxW signal peptide domain-containing protein [Serratia marcescens]
MKEAIRSRCWKAGKRWCAACVSVPAIAAMPKCWKG